MENKEKKIIFVCMLYVLLNSFWIDNCRMKFLLVLGFDGEFVFFWLELIFNICFRVVVVFYKIKNIIIYLNMIIIIK